MAGIDGWDPSAAPVAWAADALHSGLRIRTADAAKPPFTSCRSDCASKAADPLRSQDP